jgi:transcriptional regulator with XRE-family HTH domain
VEAIGEMLKNAREARKLSIKEISKETNISSNYLTALEEEDFDKLPGETYVVGFLKNYAEYLKLDVDEIVNCYKGYKIGESATPLEELTKPTSPIALANLSNIFYKHKNYFYIAGAGLFLLFLIWIFSAIFSSDIDIEDNKSDGVKNAYNAGNRDNRLENIRNLKLQDDRGYILVYKNEAFQFLVENKEIMFFLRNIQQNAVEVEAIPGKIRRSLEIEKPSYFRIESCSREIILTLKGLTENRAKIFVMIGEKLIPDATEADKGNQAVQPQDKAVVAQNEKNLKIIVEAEFIYKTYLELYLDGVKKKAGLVPAGVKERWEATENIQFKIGNAGGLKAAINGKSYNFGLPGQVANKVITWKKDVNNPNLYHIVVKDW